MKTLIAEDDFTSRLLLKEILSRYGECHETGLLLYSEAGNHEWISVYTHAHKDQPPT